MESARAAYYDGATARRRSVQLAFENDALLISENDQPLARWLYGELARHDDGRHGGQSVLRLGARSAAELARLEIADEAAIAEILRRAPELGRQSRRLTLEALRIVGWSIAAAASLIASAWLLMPLIAERLAPLVPVSAEMRLGEVANRQIRTIFSGKTCEAAAGSAALSLLTERLNSAADLPMPITVQVINHPSTNALTLPGGRIYILSGLLPTVASADELAGILAHEMGHVAHRDVMRKLIQTGGTSFLLGLLFGDVSGGGAVIIGVRMLIDSSYSRDVESGADAFAARSMTTLGRPAQPLGDWLWRLGQKDGASALDIFRSHPQPNERAAALREIGLNRLGPPLLDEAQFKALKAICS